MEGLTDAGLNTLSKFAARAIDSTATGTLGDLAGQAIGKGLGFATDTGSGAVFAGEVTASGAAFAATVTGAGAAFAASVAASSAATAGASGLGLAAKGAGAALSIGAAPFTGGASLVGLAGAVAGRYGGIVPSAAGGWQLPSFPGATPAMLHSREMVLPAHISEGLQGAIGKGGLGGGGVTFNLNAVAADGPAIERLFRNNGRLITDAVKSGIRNNALTPRSV